VRSEKSTVPILVDDRLVALLDRLRRSTTSPVWAVSGCGGGRLDLRAAAHGRRNPLTATPPGEHASVS